MSTHDRSKSVSRFSQAFAFWAIVLCFSGCTSVNPEPPRSVKPSGERKQGFKVTHKESSLYIEECSSCHVGYLPGFLPQRSWTKIMASLDDHFGQNASLDQEPAAEILAYLKEFSADSPKSSRQSKRLAKMIPEGETPIRITDTHFWRRKHGGIKAFVWKRPAVETRSKCEACHQDAAKGIFDERTAKIPKN